MNLVKLTDHFTDMTTNGDEWEENENSYLGLVVMCGLGAQSLKAREAEPKPKASKGLGPGL